MKFRISKDAKSNAGRILDVKSVHQFENGRVGVTGRISGRMAHWEGSLGSTVNFDDAEAEAWLLTQGIDWKKHGAWLDTVNELQKQEEARQQADREKRQARAFEEMAIVRAAEAKFEVAVREGVMMFDPVPQIATVPNYPGRKWVQAWVLVEV